MWEEPVKTFDSHTILPVIGIPVEGGALNGMDALLATVQMPGGIPVATVGVGSGGATNAALLAIQILALNDAALAERFAADRAARRQKVLDADEAMMKQYGN
ncbi:MAG: AIR carboxylase family protein [Victivallales bacterium]|nr:AIR carboxylase family protein [Victivallales bacterium]